MPAHMLTRTNVSKSRVLKVLSSPEEEEQEQEEEEEEEKNKQKETNNNFRYFVTCLDGANSETRHGRSSFMTRK